ncbi:MAG: endonuclease/exonuclease/phosphatase family protein [Haliea sp.]|jgi:endonuclease/exonuclease/phosphatase (EEP) superfamily protein YafD
MSRSAISQAHQALRSLAAAGLLLLSAQVPAENISAEDCAAGLGSTVFSEGAALGPDLQILSWNIQKAGNSGWLADLQQLSAGVELAFLQEAAIDTAIGDTLLETRHQSFAPGWTNGRKTTGVMTLSRHKASLECDFSAKEPLLRTPKATAVTEYPLLGREDRLLAINIHSVNFSFGLTRYREQLQALSAVIERHEGPVLIAGDLNTWNPLRVRAVSEFMASHDLTAVEFKHDLRTTVFGNPLDHILIRGLETAAAYAIPVDSSDHNPLLVSLRLP